MKVNINRIADRLFETEAKKKIVRDYCIPEPQSSEDLVKLVLDKLNQRACEHPLEQEFTNNQVFEAAVRALASNSRNWSTFLKNKEKIAAKLSQFLVEEVAKRPPPCFELAELLPGQTSGADACAILSWANFLSELQGKNYYSDIIKSESERLRARLGSSGVASHELFLCVVAHFTDPSSKARGRKWPGMGFALGSEFLRNLHWNGFKPDRHIRRLLSLWVKEQNVDREVEVLKKVIGRGGQELLGNLRLSLVGASISPDDYRSNYSQIDNRIWLLGAYVEKKGHESNESYIVNQDQQASASSLS